MNPDCQQGIAKKRKDAFSSNWFEKLFARLNAHEFHCSILSCLSFVPIELLFGKKNCKTKTINCLSFDLTQMNVYCAMEYDYVRTLCFINSHNLSKHEIIR